MFKSDRQAYIALLSQPRDHGWQVGRNFHTPGPRRHKRPPQRPPVAFWLGTLTMAIAAAWVLL